MQNGILSVTAKDKATNKQQSITITGASTLAKEEVERMVKDAEANAEADKKRSEQIDLKNEADALRYQTRKQIDELGDKVPADQKSKIEGLLTELEEATKKEEFEKIKDLNKTIKERMVEIGQSAYSQTGGAQGAANTSDEAIETDFSAEK